MAITSLIARLALLASLVLEVFNAFNHANYGSYVLNESNVKYRRPLQNTNIAFAPRMLQLGMRVAF